MKLTTIKNARDVSLPGLTVELVHQDQSLREVHLSAGGKTYVVKAGASYSESIVLLRRDEHEEVARVRVRGDLLGSPVDRLFDDKASADRWLSDLSARLREEEVRALRVSNVTVRLDARGEVVGMDDAAAEQPADYIPF